MKSLVSKPTPSILASRWFLGTTRWIFSSFLLNVRSKKYRDGRKSSYHLLGRKLYSSFSFGAFLQNFGGLTPMNIRPSVGQIRTLLCRSKLDGGIEYCDSGLMNDALLAKQFRRLFAHPTSLVTKVPKVRYVKDCSLLDSQEDSYPSYEWQSIWRAGMKLRIEMKHRHRIEMDSDFNPFSGGPSGD